MTETAAIILAAGKSMRMNSDVPKVLHEVCGRPMLSFVLGAARLAGVDRLVVVIGHEKAQVMDRFRHDPDAVWVEQSEQKGTGHAVLCCREVLDGFEGNILVVAGDMPLIRREVLAELIEVREANGDAVTLATTVLEDPTGYGRILRDDRGRLSAIREHRDCSEYERGIREVNPSYYCFDGGRMFDALRQVAPHATTGEVYITEAVRVLRESGSGASAVVSVPAEDAMGINTRLDLARVNRAMQDRIQLGHMNEGVTIVDPDNTWIEADAMIGRDSIVHPFSYIAAGANIGRRCGIGPFAHIRSGETVMDDATVAQGLVSGAFLP